MPLFDLSKVSDVDLVAELERRRFRRERPPKLRHVYSCTRCSNVYRAGTTPVTIYARCGAAWCSKCDARTTESSEPWESLARLGNARVGDVPSE